MLSRNIINGSRSIAWASTRNYATLKEVETRLKSIKNIEKITKTMKIVASTRLSKAEKAKLAAKKMDAADKQFYNNAETKPLEAEGETPKELVIAITSDKGLCGAIHSQLAKAVRRHLAEAPQADVVTIGDKIKTQLLRSNPDNLKFSINGVGKEAPTFEESSLIADKILTELNAGIYPKISIYYNDPISSLSFEPTSKPVFNPETIEQSPSYSKFEIDADNKVSRDLFEYTLANQIMTAMAEGYP